jgi:hypothetical protein
MYFFKNIGEKVPHLLFIQRSNNSCKLTTPGAKGQDQRNTGEVKEEQQQNELKKELITGKQTNGRSRTADHDRGQLL